jgi:cytochrome c oxidase assembly protein subunit 15
VHRNFGRLIGLAFLLPMAWFVATGAARGRLAARLAAIFLLGGAQGLAGWYMVQSGLEEGIDVSQHRLAVHLVLAFLILGAILWTVFDLGPRRAPRRGPAHAGALGAAILVGGIVVQVIAGALVAGLRAGRSYNTWPLMDGALIPDGLVTIEPWYLNLSDNVLTVQFDHRMIAYLLLAGAVAHWRLLPAGLRNGPAGSGALAVAILIALQIALGAATVILAVPLALGLLHQAGALAVFAAALHHLHGLLRGRAQGSAQAAASA